MKQGLRQSQQTLFKAKRIEIQYGKKIKIIKEMIKKYLFHSFRKDNYSSHEPKRSAEKHRCYKRSLVTKHSNKQRNTKGSMNMIR